jgi:BMFP domain-containing protein YqiC
MRTARENMKFLNDLAKMAGGAVGSFSEVREQVKTLAKEGIDKILSEMDIVTRAEFERVEAMAQKAREKQEALEKRLAALEGKKSPAPKAVKKSAPVKKKKKK